MTTRRASKLQPGDRVRERERVRDDVVTSLSPNFRQVFRYLREQRYGTVAGIEMRRVRSGASCQYVKVIWDGMQTPSVHARGRLEKISAEVSEQQA